MNGAALEQLLQQARKARDDAGRSLAEERVGQQQLMTHIELLRTYRLEYTMQLQHALGNGLPLTSLSDFQGFLTSLDQALHSGQRSLAEKEQRLLKAQETWREKQKRLDTFEALHRRHVEAEQRLESRREQRGTDELSSQFAARERLRQAQLTQEQP